MVVGRGEGYALHIHSLHMPGEHFEMFYRTRCVDRLRSMSAEHAQSPESDPQCCINPAWWFMYVISAPTHSGGAGIPDTKSSPGSQCRCHLPSLKQSAKGHKASPLSHSSQVTGLPSQKTEACLCPQHGLQQVASHLPAPHCPLSIQGDQYVLIVEFMASHSQDFRLSQSSSAPVTQNCTRSLSAPVPPTLKISLMHRTRKSRETNKILTEQVPKALTSHRKKKFSIEGSVSSPPKSALQPHLEVSDSRL